MLIKLKKIEMEKAKTLRIKLNLVSNSILGAINEKYQEALKESLTDLDDEIELETWCELYDWACEEQRNVISEFYGTEIQQAERLEAMESKIASMLRNKLDKNIEGGLK